MAFKRFFQWSNRKHTPCFIKIHPYKSLEITTNRISILFIKISRYLSKPRIWKIALFYLAYWPYQKFKNMITFGLSGDSRVIFRNHHKSKFLLSFSSLGDVKRIDPEALLEVFFNIKFRFYVFARHSWFQVSLKNKLFNEGSSPFKTI